MMNNTIAQVAASVADIIDELVGSNELFTAYDVTCILRRKNLAQGLTHWQIKDMVHDFYLTGNMGFNYGRTSTSFSGTNALVYLPSGTNVNDYDSTKHTQGIGTPATNLTAVTAPVIAAKVTATVTNADEVTADTRGRITVPKKFVVSIGNQWVNVDKSADKKTVKIYKGNLFDSNALSVDQYGNIKVSLGKDKAGSTYEFTVVGSDVYATQTS